MYGKNQKKIQDSQSSSKNPNRVTGGIKGQGVDHIVMVSEDGFENQVPTHKYVQSLEEQLRKQRAAISVLERKVSRQETAITTISQRRVSND
tara:strand:+ start:398 stop:673 length:276 start_codon:yes stop_codon:yes gene_type:complete